MCLRLLRGNTHYIPIRTWLIWQLRMPTSSPCVWRVQHICDWAVWLPHSYTRTLTFCSLVLRFHRLLSSLCYDSEVFYAISLFHSLSLSYSSFFLSFCTLRDDGYSFMANNIRKYRVRLLCDFTQRIEYESYRWNSGILGGREMHRAIEHNKKLRTTERLMHRPIYG